jgi:o-succinylbenzoate---CoA ligase
VEIGLWLARAAAGRRDGVALVTPEERLTYDELLLAATRAASRLVSRGARPGDRIRIELPPGRAFVATVHGCLLLRAPAMPIDLRLSERERSGLACGAEVLVSQPLADEGGAPFNLADPGEDEPALVVHTSGTTRTPRPVELTFGNLDAHIRAVGAVLGADPDERWLVPMPLSHVGGLMVLVRSAAAAGTVVLEPPPFDADRVARLLREGEITLVSLVPTMLARILEAGGRPGPRLRRVLLGGGPVPPGLLRRAVEAGWPVSQNYGLTEAASTVTLAEPGDLETAGAPLPGLRVSIADDGEILIEGPTVVGATLRTGDLGSLDEQGRLTVLGRNSDTIVSGGENVAPAEVEAVLEEHPQVAEAGVFGRADPQWGESVTALIVPRGEVAPTAGELRAHCVARLAGYKVPKAFELAEQLPRTASGKLLRRNLT